MTAPAPEMTDYARRRLSGRVTGAIGMAGFCLFAGAATLVASRVSVGEVVVGSVLALGLAANLVAWIRPVHPGNLTPVAWPEDGSWRAAMQLTQFHEVVATRPQVRDSALVMGRITFDAQGATFTSGKGATRAYGTLRRRWDSADIYAQRLRGWGGQGHLMLVPATDHHAPVDIWIWGSRAFPVDTSRN